MAWHLEGLWGVRRRFRREIDCEVVGHEIVDGHLDTAFRIPRVDLIHDAGRRESIEVVVDVLGRGIGEAGEIGRSCRGITQGGDDPPCRFGLEGRKDITGSLVSEADSLP